MKKRRLSIPRVIIAILTLIGISYYSFRLLNNVNEISKTTPYRPWFGPYVDVTATPKYNFEQLENLNIQNNYVLAFIVSSNSDPCLPTWGNAYTLDEASDELDLDRRIERYRQLGGNIAISFGGLLNNELAVNCKDNQKLKSSYMSIIDRYKIDTLDFDIENDALKDADSVKRRSVVLAQLQKEMRSNNKNLAIWLTLPVSPQGLTTEGTEAIKTMLSNGIDLTGVNIMTMDYGESKDKNLSMAQASREAVLETRRQLEILYKQVNINLTDKSLWAKIGVTPMIGQNDIQDEILTLQDASDINQFAKENGIGRISFWSANRDIQCGENYANINVVSSSCSGIKQNKLEFSNILSKNFDGKITDNSSSITKSENIIAKEPDNPNESPYQIWSESATYLAGTKVVWHHNVYQAKWWTKGDVPDNPVLQTWQTPWQLIGPVLPGEKPIPQPTLPAWTYPAWSGETIYNQGDIVLFQGIPYEAKWWNQGESPAASTSNPDSSPWRALTKKEIEKILQQIQ